MKKKGKFKSIGTQITLGFIIFSVTPFLFLGFYIYYEFQNSVKEREIETLDAIADRQIKFIETHIRQIKKDVTEFSETPVVRSALEAFNQVYKGSGIDSPAYMTIVEEYGPFFTRKILAREHYDLFLINSEGDVLFTVAKEADLGTNLISGEFKETNLAQVFKKTRSTFINQLSKFQMYEPSKQSAAFISAPVFKDQKLIGVVAYQLSTKALYEAAQNFTGLGETGELIFGSLEGEEALFKTPTRFDPNAAFSRRVKIGSELALPIQDAVRGINGEGISVDYRNKKILAIWRYIPSLDWGMVVKMDLDEAYRNIYQIQKSILIICLITIILVIVIAKLYSKSIVYPLLRLKDSIQRVAMGNLNEKIEKSENNEIGELAESFNRMTEMIQEGEKDLKLRAKELALSNQKLEQVNKELEGFSYSVSHDLRAPLRHMSGFAELLKKHADTFMDEKSKHYAQVIQEAAEKMNRLIEGILKFSRASRAEIDKKEVNLNQVVDNVKEELKPEYNDRKVEWNVLPLPKVKADETLLHQVLTNLMSNALKFTQTRKLAKIEVGALQGNGDETTFYVRDNGVGFDMRYVDKLFGVFQRLHTDKEFEGNGVGLANVKKIISRHGGKVWAESQNSNGAIFYFTLPK